MDAAMTRPFSIMERVRLEMRAGAYNALNHSNWGTPNRFVNTPQCGSITERHDAGAQVSAERAVVFLDSLKRTKVSWSGSCSAIA